MKIGDLTFPENPIFLAPMEDVTDIGFRELCKQFGADMVYSEFVSSDALIRRVNKTIEKMKISEEERPVAIQIYGREVNAMVDAALIVEEFKPDILDINFGCPVKKVAGKGAGSGLLKTPDLMIEIVENIVKKVKLPVTVKTRLGWDENSKIIVELAERLQDVGAKALTIHGRTRSQMYTGQADWSLIKKVKDNARMKIPIIGNGDVTNPIKCKERFEESGVDAVMIGRGSIGAPWVFGDTKEYLSTGILPAKKSFEYYTSILLNMLKINVDRVGERGGIIHTRRHLAASPIFKGIDDFKKTRIQLLRSESVQEIEGILREIPEKFELSLANFQLKE